MKLFASWFTCLALVLPACGAPSTAASPATPLHAAPVRAEVVSPGGDDLYARLVARAEAGDETVDLLALRRAYLESPAFAQAPAQLDRVAELRAQMVAAISARDHATVRDRARAILALQYIDLPAQKARYQACQALEDDACASRGRYVEHAMLQSIVSSGDGRSCAHAWNAVTVDEEHFVLRMIDAKLQRQSVATEGDKVCDRLDITDVAGQPSTYYFDITAMLSAENKALGDAGHSG